MTLPAKFARIIHRVSFAGLLAAGTWLDTQAAASAQSVNMAGRNIQITIGTTTGGAFDLYARLVAQHIGQFLPGHPTTAAVNIPGAGGIIELNWLYNVAPKDGTAFGIVPLSAVFESLLGNNQAHYDARHFSWLGSLDDYDGSAVVWGGSPFKTAQDILDHEVIIGGGGTGSDITIWPNLLRTLIGAKIKLVSGYIGTANVALAMERGEVQGMIGQDWDGLKASKADWIRDGRIRPLMQIALQRRDDLKDVPTVMEFAKNPEDKSVLELFIAREMYSRPFTAPPGVSPAVLATMRQAFAKMAKDPDFRAD
ncbi:MAG TPA: tripartite tricarboxylate transporter substrate-binding protein, partial [Beijerinckiaceae bacterium]|nr:tripartite tricarboxylate transporter substrate-binding protein [Beijerinckiaceae bacterium]